eukprot:9496964-Pyramimonas_sp.AAC.1
MQDCVVHPSHHYSATTTTVPEYYFDSNRTLLIQYYYGAHYSTRVRLPSLNTPMLEFHDDHCQYQSTTTTAQEYHFCDATAPMVHNDCYSATATAQQ